jgi:hypothetical protein
MKKYARPKLVFLSLITLALPFIFYLNSSSQAVTEKRKASSLIQQPLRVFSTRVINHSNLTFDQKCKAFGEWENLGKHVFIKRTAVYYFKDANLVHLLLLSRSNKNLGYELNLQIYHESNTSFGFDVKLDKNDVYVKGIWAISEYNLNSVSAKFSLNSLAPSMTKKYIQGLKMRLFVKDTVSNNKTDFPLDVKIKTLTSNYHTKRGAMICNKGVHLTKKDDFLSFRWWVELNKEIGYEKIYISNHSIENDASFHDLFRKNRDFIELATLRCIPNLQDFKEFANFTYLKKHSDLVYNINNYAVLKFELINVLILNECYLSHIDKFKYISVVDVDETVLPVKTSNFLTLDQISEYVATSKGERNEIFENIKCDRYDSSLFVEEKTVVESYMNELAVLAKIKKPVALHFQHGFQVTNSLAEKVIDSIEETLKMHQKLAQVNSSSSNINYTVNVFDLHKEKDDNVSFVFTIQSEFDLKYAASLVKIFRVVVKPYINENKDIFEKHIRGYDRFFYVGGQASSFACGKTIHDTRSTFDTTIHYAENILDLSNKSAPVIDYDKSKYWLRLNYISSQNGHSSHFRRSYGYLSEHYRRVPIREFQLDLNYLICYFIPILKRIQDSKA